MESVGDIFQWWGIVSVMSNNVCSNILSWSNLVKGKFRKCVWESTFLVVIWTLWLERNKIKFNSQVFSYSKLINLIKARVGEWIVCYCPKFQYPAFQVTDNLHAIFK